MEKSLEEVMDLLLSKHVIVSTLYIIITIVVMAAVDRAAKASQKKVEIEDLKLRSYIRILFNGLRIVILTIATFAVLQANDINISSMITGVGLVSAIAGLAMQDLFKDIIMGAHIVNDDSIAVGEVVEINGIEGIVLSFSPVTTRLRDLGTGDIVSMCNRNITQVAKKGGVYVTKLRLRFDEDPERVRKIMTAAAKEMKALKGITNAEYMGIQEFTETAAVYMILFRCSPKIHYQMQRAATAIVQKHVMANHLEIPYPQMDVHEK